MSLFGFGAACDIEFELDKSGTRKSVEALEDGKKVKHLVYYDGEDVGGTIHIKLKKPGSKIEHQGIRLEFVGEIELFYDRSNHHVFTSIGKLLNYPGEISDNLSIDFNFAAIEKQYESYSGANVKLRYFLRLVIIKRFSNIVKEEEIHVHALSAYPETNNSLKMEVGIEDCLHIEFEYNKSKYHLKDVIIGKIYFLLVRIKVKHMELAIIKREIVGDNGQSEAETVGKYEIMDGAPVKGESIPIRLFLGAYDLAPTMRDIQKKFSCKYYLNLVLVDEEERRYFKQQEIVLWRKADKYKSKQERSDQMQLYESQADPIKAAAAAAAANNKQQQQQQQQVPQQQSSVSNVSDALSSKLNVNSGGKNNKKSNSDQEDDDDEEDEEEEDEEDDEESNIFARGRGRAHGAANSNKKNNSTKRSDTDDEDDDDEFFKAAAAAKQKQNQRTAVNDNSD